jgi:hypothetical protein
LETADIIGQDRLCSQFPTGTQRALNSDIPGGQLAAAVERVALLRDSRAFAKTQVLVAAAVAIKERELKRIQTAHFQAR